MRIDRSFPKLALLLLAAACLTGCLAKSDASQGATPAATAKSAPAAKPSVPVDVAPVAVGPLTAGVEVTGTLVPKFKAEVKSEYAGIVTHVYVTEWVRVSRGQALAKLDTREAEIMLKKAQAAVEVARSGLLQTQVQEARANREYDRMVRLKNGGLATQQALDEALTAKQAAEAQTAAVKTQVAAAEEEVLHAKTRLSKALITAPMNGVVARRDVNVGDLAGEMGSPRIMFLIVDNSLLELTVTVPSFEMDKVKLGQSLDFTTDAIPGKTFTGTVKYINPMVNEADRSLTLVAEVRNTPEILKGGLYVKGRILTEERPAVLQAPRAALVNWDMKARKGEVFVVEGAVARKRAVTTGAVAGENVEIVDGLKEGEKVILRGSFQVRDGDAVAAGAR
ncbi:MAG: efflux RND transporter periplasmic adaptor subunit [Acidobacteria bacterium]|nr:efflux RND transporter periplasmic adaptor subunit [Acidobacteriota bacterium]